MAPHQYRELHGCGDSSKYLLRKVVKVGENKRRRSRCLDTSEVRDKEDFLCSMGLQMRRRPYESNVKENIGKCRKITMPAGVKLRECKVVIKGVQCGICGKNFKCKTDVHVHSSWRHGKCLNAIVDGFEPDNRSTLVKKCEICEERFERDIEKRMHMKKLHRSKAQKLRLILKIAGEVITEIDVKRKHLKINAIDTGTQTEYDVAGVLFESKNDYECRVTTIDPPGPNKSFSSSPVSRIQARKTANQYLDDALVPAKRKKYDENYVPRDKTEERTSCGFVSPAKKFLVSSNDRDDDLSNVLRFAVQPLNDNMDTYNKENVQTQCEIISKCVDPAEDRLALITSEVPFCGYRITSMDTSEPVPQVLKNTVNITNDFLPKSKHVDAFKQTSTSVKEDIATTNEVLFCGYRRIPTSNPEPVPQVLKNSGNITNDSLPKSKHVDAFKQTSTFEEEDACPTQKYSNFSVCTNTRHPEDRTKHGTIVHEDSSAIRKNPPSNAGTAEANDDNEVQEVLRITRGIKERADREINHESPNRSEREMLVMDAIRDMIEMEKRGLHLLGRKLSPKKRKEMIRLSSKNKSIEKETAATAEEHVVPETNELPLRSKEHEFSRVPTSVQESVTERVRQPKERMNVPLKELNRYGINYYNEDAEINNNIVERTLLTPGVERLADSLTKALQHISEMEVNHPEAAVLIDLVDDGDE
ncbi:hypothetical protein KM043_005001 [Ampulex compressa]|nr:hypothetical protein KM043_005001 [Ampulex compressa]